MKKNEAATSADDLEFTVDSLTENESNSDIMVEEQKIAESPVYEEPEMQKPVEPKIEDFQRPEEKIDQIITEAQTLPALNTNDVEINTNEEINPKYLNAPMETYRVQRGDTMMMVAFKIYGDYRKWKDLTSWNKEKSKLSEGVELKYQVPDSKFGWAPNGLPYLVKKGDTLQIVSMDKYGTTRKWKSIYNNNTPLIRDPNLIFAGFTIYYQPTRELASEQK
jgi:nucleoid-associated protein YgaU